MPCLFFLDQNSNLSSKCIRFLKTKENPKGQTIVEIIIAVGLAAMVVTAVLVLSAAATKSATSSLRRSQASKIGVLALETVRFFRDTNGYAAIPDGDICPKIPSEDASSSTSLEFTNGGGSPYSCSDYQTFNFNGIQYDRRIEIRPEQNNSREVIVTVRWVESLGTKDGDSSYRDVVFNTKISRW